MRFPSLVSNFLTDLHDPMTSYVGYTNDPAVTDGPIFWLSIGAATLWFQPPKIRLVNPLDWFSITPTGPSREPVRTFEARQ
jgi:hypothetical protein